MVEPDRDLGRGGHNPLFQTMLALQNVPRPTLSLPGLTLLPEEVEVRTSPFDLTLVASEEDGRLYVSWIWALDLFDAPTVARFAGRFRNLLAAAAAEPERPFADLPMISEAERHALLHEWLDAATPLPEEPTLHRIVAAHVAHRPRALAVEDGGTSLTYEELDRRARRLAGRLRRLGVGPDVPVGLCAGNAIELAVGMLATIQAGGAYLPLDPEYPRERLAFLLEDAQPAALLAPRELAERFPAPGVPVFLLDEEAVLDPEPFDEPAVQSDHLACIFYTSGSTGRPKGVGITHRCISRLILDPRWEIGPDARIAQLSSPSFDASTLEIWGALLRGACLVGLRREEVLAPQNLAAAIRQLGLTMLVIPPSWFQRVAAALPNAFAPLSIMSIGGEPGDPTAFARVVEAGAPRWLFHGYGPTEVTTLTTVNPVRAVAPGQPILPAGRPLADVRVYILDSELRLLPQGAPGELYAGGDRLARGYLGRPDLTAERFVPDPYGPSGGRLYATGDLARLLPGGALEILGRRDRQVKIRGFRIEPGEIEAVLAEHPAVAQAAVVVQQTPAREDGGRRLVAFVVPRGEVDVPGIRAWLAERLPAFMIPAAFVVRLTLPLTPNDKIDREALARQPLEIPADGGRTKGPLTRTEESLASIWRDLLKNGQDPQPHESFFDLGGHSLLAMWLVTRIHETFGVELPLMAVFDTPTLAGLAARIDSVVRATTEAPWSPLVRLAAGPEGAAPLFCVHGAGGNISVFADLARLLQEERSVYGVQARGLEEGQTPLETIEEMAELYVGALREVRPRGPYRLLGYSMGGLIAYEMACRLAAEGERVDQVVLLDIPPDGSDPGPPPLDGPGGQEPGTLDFAIIRRHRAVWRANRDASPLWRPGRYAGNVLLVLTDEGFGPIAAAGDPTLGWGDLVAGRVDIARVSGNHYNVLGRASVEAVADAVRAAG
jgi:amino acid adenylation domain-containing protein